MSKPCLLHPTVGDTNSSDSICRICRVFEPEKVAEYLKTHTIEQGARPQLSKNHAVYGYASRQESIKKGQYKNLSRPVKRRTPERKLSKQEEAIFNTLSTIGEDVEIIKKLEVV